VFQLVKAFNGQEALVQIRLENVKPDLVLCDLKMPVMDGFEFIKVLRGEQGLEFKDVPVLVLSGNKDPESLKRAIELGIQGYLVKPVMIKDLISRMTHALSSSK
jgi:CheY-like chemotaxis protein